MTRLESCWNFALFGGGKPRALAYSQVAASCGYKIQHFESMHDLDYLGRFREFDAAIVHQTLQPLSGLELAEYLEKLFQSLPMILLIEQEEEMDRLLPRLPSSVIECLPACHCPQEVFERALAAIQTRATPYLAAVKPSLA